MAQDVATAPNETTNQHPNTADIHFSTEQSLINQEHLEADALLQDYQAARWRETECRFDSPIGNNGRSDPRRIRLIFPTTDDEDTNAIRFEHGEFLIDNMNNIEDTQGNNGKGGRLLVTNLRLIWLCYNNPKINLSIGHRCVKNLIIHRAESVLRGVTRALLVKARSTTYVPKKRKQSFFGSVKQPRPSLDVEVRERKFQFIFTNVVEGSPRLFTTIQEVQRAYNSSRLFREVRLRTQISKNHQLLLLPHEEIEKEITGVMSIHGEEAVGGTLVWTNVRVCWISDTNELHNASLPFHEITNISLTETRFGTLIVLSLQRDEKGVKNIGFRISPQTKSLDYLQQLQLARGYAAIKPVFGVAFSKRTPDQLEAIPIDDDDVSIVGDGQSNDPFASYTSGDVKQQDRKIVFSETLGLAIEELPEGMTLKSLWRVH